MPASASWQLADRIASHADGGVTTRLDLETPARGLVVGSANGVVDHLLGLDLADRATVQTTVSPLTDHWLRGGDLTAVYEPADDRRLRASIMWRRRGPSGPATAWEAVVSAQTALVESDGTLAVVCDVAPGELLCAPARPGEMRWSPLVLGTPLPDEASCLLVRRHADQAATSVLVAVHPGDARRITTRSVAGRVRIVCRLFSAEIEKGVLLRSRVLAAVGPAAGDPAWAEPLVEAFAASPPPLTT